VISVSHQKLLDLQITLKDIYDVILSCHLFIILFPSLFFIFTKKISIIQTKYKLKLKITTIFELLR